MTDSRFGRAVRLVRVARNRTQGQLAAAAGISRAHLIAIEGGHWPRPRTRNQIVNALGFGLYEDLLGAAAEGSLRSLKVAPARCACGAPIPAPGARRGRPRKRCPACAGDRAALARGWRAAHPDQVQAYNAARRSPAGG